MAIRTNLQPGTKSRRDTYKKSVRLISGGFSCRAAWPDGMITVYPWDHTIDEYLYEAGRKTDSSSAVYGLLERCCDLNGAKIGDVVASEVTSLLLTSRALGVGGRVRYETVCPHCKHKDMESILIPEELGVVGQKELDYAGFDSITLPECGDVVTIRPLLVKDERLIEERPREEKESVSDTMLRLLASIVTVGGGAPENIREALDWYEKIPPGDARYLDQKRIELAPRLDSKILHGCDRCRREFAQTLTFDMQFFR